MISRIIDAWFDFIDDLPLIPRIILLILTVILFGCLVSAPTFILSILLTYGVKSTPNFLISRAIVLIIVTLTSVLIGSMIFGYVKKKRMQKARDIHVAYNELFNNAETAAIQLLKRGAS